VCEIATNEEFRSLFVHQGTNSCTLVHWAPDGQKAVIFLYTMHPIQRKVLSLNPSGMRLTRSSPDLLEIWEPRCSFPIFHASGLGEGRGRFCRAWGCSDFKVLCKKNEVKLQHKFLGPGIARGFKIKALFT
jgi:hypothetical protein